MKILLVTHFFPPRHNAGTENYTLGLATALQALGHSVKVLCAEDWDSGDAYWNTVSEDFHQGINVTRIHLNWMRAGNPNRVLYDSEPVNEWMSHYLQRESFDLVHVTSAASLGVGILEKVKSSGIPLILTLMDFWFICPSTQLLRSDGEVCDGITTARQCQTCLMGSSGVSHRLSRLGVSSEFQASLWETLLPLNIVTRQRGFRGYLLNMTERKQLLKQILELPDLILTHSETVKEMFSHHSINVKVLKNGHELSWLKSYRGKTANDVLRVGYVGQIIPIKGVHILIEAFKKAKIDRDAKLEIWGGLEKDTGYVHKLRTLIGDNSSITLHGRFLHDDLADVLSEIDVMVVPSTWYENAPLVIQESFAAQTPVIASDLGGMAEMVLNEVNGLLFERGNADNLARQLKRLVEDSGLLEQLKSGIPLVKTIDQEVVELETIYLEIMQREKNKETKEL